MREIIMWARAIGLVVIALGIGTVILELILHRRKQARYDELHRGMGLDAIDPPSMTRREK